MLKVYPVWKWVKPDISGFPGYVVSVLMPARRKCWVKAQGQMVDKGGINAQKQGASVQAQTESVV
jgi:hypothetical protein